MPYDPAKATKAEIKRHMVDVLDRVKRALILDVDSRLVLATPVDTGRARAGWNVSKNTPDLSAPPDRTSRDPIDLAPSSNPNTDYYDTNNVEYIQPLNDGHSAQAPAGFVEASVAASREFGQQIVRTIDGVS